MTDTDNVWGDGNGATAQTAGAWPTATDPMAPGR